MQKTVILLIGLCVLVAARPAPAADPAEIGSQRQLFLDDHLVATISGLQRTMHAPMKRGAVIRSPDPNQTIQTRSAPQWDPVAKLYKLWVIGIDQNLWESRDGLHWTPGAKSNMKIMLAIYDPNEPDLARRYKAPLLNSGFAVSPDGARWTRVEVDKIASSDEGNFSYDPKHGLFIHTIKRGGPFGRSVAVATSRDFRDWKDYGVIFHADKLDQKLGGETISKRLADKSFQPTFHVDPKVWRVDVYNMGTFYYEGLYIGMPSMFHSTGMVPNYPNTDGFHVVKLVMSRDLKTWSRLGDRQAFIGPSRIGSGAYDLTQILCPSAPVLRDDELWFYYTGLKYRSTFIYKGKYPNGEHLRKPGLGNDFGAICLAVLRRDGFVSLDASAKTGTLVTKPFVLPPGRLFVNANSRLGELKVELLDADGNTVAESEADSSDTVRREVKWSQSTAKALKGRVGEALSLRVTMRNSQLYSFWFQK